MKAIIILIFLLIPVLTKAQQNQFKLSETVRQDSMIAFLKRKWAILPETDSATSKKYLTTTTLFESGKGKEIKRVIMFCGASPHSGRYIALETYYKIILLESVDLAAELPDIILFVKQENVNSRMLMIISNEYHWNQNLNFR